MRQATFPESFSERVHPIGDALGVGATQWQLFDSTGKAVISVVHGPRPFFYCGPTTYEMWDFVGEPRGYMTKDDINTYLKSRGITEPELTDDMIVEIKPGGSGGARDYLYRKRSSRN